jgi:hypothetical protein
MLVVDSSAELLNEAEDKGKKRYSDIGKKKKDVGRRKYNKANIRGDDYIRDRIRRAMMRGSGSAPSPTNGPMSPGHPVPQPPPGAHGANMMQPHNLKKQQQPCLTCGGQQF